MLLPWDFERQGAMTNEGHLSPKALHATPRSAYCTIHDSCGWEHSARGNRDVRDVLLTRNGVKTIDCMDFSWRMS